MFTLWSYLLPNDPIGRLCKQKRTAEAILNLKNQMKIIIEQALTPIDRLRADAQTPARCRGRVLLNSFVSL